MSSFKFIVITNFMSLGALHYYRIIDNEKKWKFMQAMNHKINKIERKLVKTEKDMKNISNHFVEDEEMIKKFGSLYTLLCEKGRKR